MGRHDDKANVRVLLEVQENLLCGHASSQHKSYAVSLPFIRRDDRFRERFQVPACGALQLLEVILRQTGVLRKSTHQIWILDRVQAR